MQKELKTRVYKIFDDLEIVNMKNQSRLNKDLADEVIDYEEDEIKTEEQLNFLGKRFPLSFFREKEEDPDQKEPQPEEKKIEEGKLIYPELVDNLEQYDGKTLPYENNSFDVVTMFDVIEHIDKIEQYLFGEVRRVLKKDGVLRLAVPDFDSLIKVYQKTGDIQNILGPLYGHMDIQTPFGSKSLYHRTVYNFNSICSHVQ